MSKPRCAYVISENSVPKVAVSSFVKAEMYCATEYSDKLRAVRDSTGKIIEDAWVAGENIQVWKVPMK